MVHVKHKHHLFVQHIIQLRTFCDTCSVVVYINSFGIFSFLFFYPKHILDLAFFIKTEAIWSGIVSQEVHHACHNFNQCCCFPKIFFVNFADCDIYSEKTSFVAVLFELPIQEKKKKNENIASNIHFFPPPTPVLPFFFPRIRNFLFRFPLCRYVVLEMFCLILNWRKWSRNKGGFGWQFG